MTQFTKLFFILSVAMIPAAVFAVNPADLVKVNGETQAKCVEYYAYKGESYCSTKALSAEPVDPAVKDYEKQLIVFDERPWHAAWGKKTDDMVMVEYVPFGADINNWHELVTSQYFAGLQDKATPKEFADTVIKQMRDAHYKVKVSFLKIQPDECIFEFSISQPHEQKQNELQIIRKGKDGLYVLHYVIKDSDMGVTRRRQWQQNLINSSIKSP